MIGCPKMNDRLHRYDHKQDVVICKCIAKGKNFKKIQQTSNFN